MDDTVMSVEDFNKHIDSFVLISDRISDGWKMNIAQRNSENNKFVTKKHTVLLKDSSEIEDKILATFEYHIAYNISYGVPVLCFHIWKQNGSMITLEEYWNHNENLQDYNMNDTLTQMDHPVLNRPVFTLHPCKTQEILQGFLKSSKNPIISWLSVVSRFVHLEMQEEYLKSC